MSADGTWTLSMDSPMGQRELTFEAKTDGNALTGTIDFMGMGAAEISDGVVDGNTVTWKADLRGNDATYTGSIEGDTISGTIDIEGRGSTPFTGVRAAGSGAGTSSTTLYLAAAGVLLALLTAYRLRHKAPRRARR